MLSPLKILFVIMFLILSSATQASRVVTFDDLEGVRTEGDSKMVTSDLSTDGRYFAVAPGGVLQVMDTSTGHVLYELGEGQLPRWSPSGSQLAFYSLRSGSMQLWIWNSDDSQVWQLTDVKGGVDPDPTTRVAGYAIEAFDYAWSPDGARLVFASRVDFPIPGWEDGAPLVLDRSTPPERTLMGVFSHASGATGGIAAAPDGRQYQYRALERGKTSLSRLFIADVETRVVKMLDGQVGNVFNPQWSPDGQEIAFAVIDEAATDIFSASLGEIRVRNLITGSEAVVASGTDVHHRPRWSPDGATIAYLLGNQSVDIGLVTIDRQERETYAFAKRVRKFDWAHDGGGLLLSYVDDDMERRLVRFDFTSSPLQSLATGVDRHWSQALDGTLVWIEGLWGPDIWMLSSAVNAPVRVASLAIDDSQDGLQLGRLETINYSTPQGQKLEGRLLYPPDYQPGKVYPLIVDGYPLLGGSYWMNPMLGNQAWAAMGYLVFKPYARAPHAWANCSGDPDFCALGRGPQGWDVMVDDVMSGVDELIRRGLVDPTRMCAYGFSNGGGLVSYLITRTDRFACAVIVAPVWPNWVGAPLLSLQTWQLMSDWVGVDVLADPEAYVKMSAIFRARQVKTPVLIAAGDEDGMFLLGAIEMYNALRFAGADVTLLRYPDQGHVFKDDGLLDLWRREMVFFERHLKPDRSGTAAISRWATPP